MLVHASAEAKKWKNDKLGRLIRNRATTGRHSSARSPHREQIISLGPAADITGAFTMAFVLNGLIRP
jgi:hypothetical protein